MICEGRLKEANYEGPEHRHMIAQDSLLPCRSLPEDFQRDHSSQPPYRNHFPPTMIEVHRVFKTSQENAVTHFIRHRVSFCSIRMNAWLFSKFSDIQEFKCHFKNFVLYLAQTRKNIWRCNQARVSHTVISFYIILSYLFI